MSKYTLEDINNFRVLCEAHDEGHGREIAKKCAKAYEEGRTNVRFSILQRDFLGYKLENLNLLPDDEIESLRKACGYTKEEIEERKEKEKRSIFMLNEGLKMASGTYLNLFSEIGYDNFGLKAKVDIFIIFPEYMGDDINLDDVEGRAQAVVRDFAKYNEPFYELSALKSKLENALIDFEVQVMVKRLPNY